MITVHCHECWFPFETTEMWRTLCPACFRYSKLSPEEQFMEGPPESHFGINPRDSRGNVNERYEKIMEGDVYAGTLPEHEEFNTVRALSKEERVKAWKQMQGRTQKQSSDLKAKIIKVSDFSMNQKIKTLKETLEGRYHVA